MNEKVRNASRTDQEWMELIGMPYQWPVRQRLARTA